MFGVVRQESIDREQVLRDEVKNAMDQKSVEAKILSSQVAHLSKSLHSLRGKIDENADFSVDAISQVRAEFDNAVNAQVEKRYIR